ncbi:hypothetical protein JCM10207_005360 [Rhodosporidiobolus poonsookiae]
MDGDNGTHCHVGRSNTVPSAFADAPSPYFQAPTFAPHNGPIPLTRESHPLLHQLLESADYKDAITRNRDLHRRPSKTAKRTASRAAKSKPLKAPSASQAPAAMANRHPLPAATVPHSAPAVPGREPRTSSSTISNSPYPTRAHPDHSLRISSSTLRRLADPPARPPTAFQSAVGQLKRMLTRNGRTPARTRSGAESVLSGRSRTTSTWSSLHSPSSAFLNLCDEQEELEIPPSQAAPPASPRNERSTASRSPVASVPPRKTPYPPIPIEYGSLPPSFRPPALSSSGPPTSPSATVPRTNLPPRTSSLRRPTLHPPPSPTSPPSQSKPAGRPTPQHLTARLTARSPAPLGDSSAAREARLQLLQLLRDGPDGRIASPSVSSVLSGPSQRGVAAVLAAKARSASFTTLGQGRKPAGEKNGGSGGGSRWGPRRRRSKRRAREQDDEEVDSPRPSLARGGSGMRTLSRDSFAADEGSSWRHETVAAPHPSAHLHHIPSTTRRTLDRSHSLEHLASSPYSAWTVEEAARPASSYSVYGAHWLDDRTMTAAPSEYGVSVVDLTEERAGDGRMWRKWRRWVRERREVMQLREE